MRLTACFTARWFMLEPDASKRQGQLQLNPCAHYYLQEKLFAPAATAAFHDQAIAAGMLLQQ